MADTTELLPAPAARYAGCSRMFLLSEAAKGRVRTKVVGGRLFFDRQSLAAFRDQLRAQRAGHVPVEPRST